MTTTVTQSVPARQAGLVSDVPDPEVPERARRRTYTARYKRDVLAEYEAADRVGKGALLRREGLYSSLISAWRDQRDSGALQALARASGPGCGRPGPTRGSPAAQGERALGAGAGQGPQGDRGAVKTLGSVGHARDRQQQERQRAMTDQAIAELTPVVGCQGRLRRGGPAPRDPLPLAPPEPATATAAP